MFSRSKTLSFNSLSSHEHRDHHHPKRLYDDQLGQSISTALELRESKKPPMLRSLWDIEQKAIILKYAPFVVGITTRELSQDEQVFMGSGTLVECEDEGDGKFCCTILTTSTLFTHSNDNIQPHNIKIEVYPVDGKLYKGELLCYDFHYNLAAIRIQADAPFQVAKLKELDDILPIFDTEFQLDGRRPFQLVRHSELFKISDSGIAAAFGRHPLGDSLITFGSLSVEYPDLDCKELYSLDLDHEDDRGGPAVNRHGEVIGIMVADRYFLPSNIVSRWWKFYLQNKKFCRPRLGLKVANLHAASVYFLEPFLRKFPTVSSGVIVTEVAENSLACCAGVRNEDVIVQCDAAPVRSTLEFFERIWDKAGSSVELTILRLSSGDHINLKMTVDEAIQSNFYRWPTPKPTPFSHSEMLVSEDSDSCVEEISDTE